jgi:type 1 glutamine amidotransferase
VKMSKILLLVGGLDYHNTPEHRSLLASLLSGSGRFATTLTEDMGILTTDNLAGYDVVVNYTNRVQLSGEQVSALLSAVEGGKGFVGIHAATKTFLTSPSYFDMLGAWQIQHDPFKEFTVNIVDKEHPITQGIENFQIEDELFVVEGDMTKWHILARAEGHAIIYNKTFGRGRVHYNSLGHNAKTLNHPVFRQLVLRALDWVQARDYYQPAMPVYSWLRSLK